MIRFNAQLVTLDASADDTQPSRTITGIAVPWDVVANLSNDVGPVKFLKDSISVDGPMPKLLEFHDDTRVIGRVTERVSSDEGLMFSATLSKTRAADDAMALLEDGSISAVSIGAIPLKFKRVDGVMEVSEARMIELSLVSFPAYADAEIQSVYASAEEPEEIPEEESPPQPSEEDAMSELTTVEAAIATQPIYATAKKTVKMPTAGEYLQAAIAGGDQWRAFHEVLKAAAPDVSLADGAGVLPEIIVGNVYNSFIGMRPVVDAVGVRSMPASGSTFIRPKVTTHNSVGAQSPDNTTLTASTFVISAETVTKGTYGGYVNISEQIISWSDPSMLTALLDDMGRIYMNETDAVACTDLVAGATTTGAFGDPTDPADWVAKIYACANTILSAGNYLPDHLFVSGDVFAQLGSLSDTSDRPLFPQVGPMNAFGSMNAASRESTVFGLKLVVDTNFAAKTTIVGAAATGAFRCYEQQKGAIVADIGAGASTLSRDVAFRGYFAPIMVDANQFMKIPQA